MLGKKLSFLHGNLSEAEASMIDMAERDSNISQTSLIQKLLNESKGITESKEEKEAAQKK